MTAPTAPVKATAAEPGPAAGTAYPVLDFTRTAVPDVPALPPAPPPSAVQQDWRQWLADDRYPLHIRCDRAAKTLIPAAMDAAATDTVTAAEWTDPERAGWLLYNAATQYGREMLERQRFPERIAHWSAHYEHEEAGYAPVPAR